MSPVPGPPQDAPATEATRAALVVEARRRLVAYLEHEAEGLGDGSDPSVLGEVRSLVSDTRRTDGEAAR
jgi:hypothetical protein